VYEYRAMENALQKPRRWHVAHADVAILIFTFVLAAWTLCLVIVPSFRFTFHLPRARGPIETASAVVALMTAMVAYLRWSVSGGRRFLLVSVGFLALALNQAVLGILLAPAKGYSEYPWGVGRIVLAGLLLVSALQPSDTSPPDHPARRYLGVAALAIGVVAVAQTTLRIMTSTSTSQVDPGSIAGVFPGLAAGEIVQGVLGAGLFVAALLMYRRRPSPRVSVWFLLALIVGAFTHLHYMLAPTMYSDWISTGDLLRLAFSALLLVALLDEFRRAYVSERARAIFLATQVDAERLRAEELERLDRARVDLDRIVAHELLHPVAAIRTIALMLRRRWATLPDLDRDGFLAAIVSESERLRDIAETAPALGTEIDDPFDVTLRPRHVGTVAEDIRAAVPYLRDLVDLEIGPGVEDLVVCVDTSRILQVFQNLLANASIHGRPPIHVSVTTSDHSVEVRVRDHGPGMPEASRAGLFERPRGRPGGHGYGLYICRRIVEAHDGRIWIETPMGVGAMVGFSLPVEEADA
jgi:signal transduction histidine kinase